MNFKMRPEWTGKWPFLENRAYPSILQKCSFSLSFSCSIFVVLSSSAPTPNVLAQPCGLPDHASLFLPSISCSTTSLLLVSRVFESLPRAQGNVRFLLFFLILFTTNSLFLGYTVILSHDEATRPSRRMRRTTGRAERPMQLSTHKVIYYDRLWVICEPPTDPTPLAPNMKEKPACDSIFHQHPLLPNNKWPFSTTNHAFPTTNGHFHDKQPNGRFRHHHHLFNRC